MNNYPIPTQPEATILERVNNFFQAIGHDVLSGLGVNGPADSVAQTSPAKRFVPKEEQASYLAIQSK